MEFDFYKMHGAGNDFIVIDNRPKFFPDKNHAFVKHICQTHTGIGADGLLLLEDSKRAGFRMRYFNSDGNESEMCVNGSRCLCYFAFLLKVIDRQHNFEAGDGLHLGQILDKNFVRVEVKINKKSDSRTFPFDFELPNYISFIDFLNTGVPHLVLRCDQLEQIPVEDIGRQLRFHPYYAPQGTNVNFVKFSDREETLYVRTFERGVDAETLSCGSGVAACVISIADKQQPERRDFLVKTHGGMLTVRKEEEKIYLEGPVKIIFKGRYLEEDIP
jgi:diaminopimelate epimerase